MKAVFNFKGLVHLVMIAFAVASLGNVHAFLSSAGHPSEVAWALGIALGSALVIVAMMITHVDREVDPDAFWWLVATEIGLGLISGALQAAEYSKHLHLAWSVILGFGIPLVGEVCLAFAASAYIRARSRERFRTVSVTIETAVADRLESAIDELDPQTINRHVAKTINQLARQAVESVATQAAHYYQRPAAEDVTTDLAVVAPAMDKESAQIRRDGAPTLEMANEQRAINTQAKKSAILDVLMNEGPQGISAIAAAIGVHRDTARRYLNELLDLGQVENVNRKWRLVKLTVPEPEQIVLNGSGVSG